MFLLVSVLLVQLVDWVFLLMLEVEFVVIEVDFLDQLMLMHQQYLWCL